jgi:hypothetical protein
LELKSTVLEEPLLLFGHGGKHVDPKAGLAHYGPAGHPDGGQVPTSITVGFVGVSEDIETAKDWLLSLNSTIDADKENTRLFPPFPGMPTAFNCHLVAPSNLAHDVPPRDLDKALGEKSHKKKVLECSRLLIEGLRVLRGKTGRPDVVVFPWSEDVVTKCVGTMSSMRTPAGMRDFRDQLIEQEDAGQTRLLPLAPEVDALLQTGRSSWNLHAQVKSEAMEIGLPIQVLEPPTYRGESQQGDPLTPWNLATGLYYKAGGIPWRPVESDSTTCYVGIEFYRDKTSSDSRMRTCLAQVFSDLGQGLVLRGSKFRLPAHPRWTPRMDEATARNLMQDAIELFQKHNRRPPTRVVVHKSSHFSRDEVRGVEDGLQEVETVDLVTIVRRPGVQFVRRGANPPLRGTLVVLNRDRFALYTSGYTPYLKAYPGLRVPRPLLVIRHGGPSGPQRLGREMLKLTKLNWNSARFSSSLPSTLMYADFVKAVLAQTPDEQTISEDYSSYM